MQPTIENIRSLSREEKDFFLMHTAWEHPKPTPQSVIDSLINKGILVEHGVNHLGIECPVFSNMQWEELINQAYETDSEVLKALRE